MRARRIAASPSGFGDHAPLLSLAAQPRKHEIANPTALKPAAALTDNVALRRADAATRRASFLLLLKAVTSLQAAHRGWVDRVNVVEEVIE